MKILFVCTGNSCRSVMAKAYLEKRLKELGKEDVEVFSSGVISLPGMGATEEAKQVMKEEGVDISGHFSRKITELTIKEADLIFVMEKRHREYIIGKHPAAAKKTYLLKGFKKLGDFKITDDPEIKDPIAKDINFYREVFLIIKDSVERILEQI